MVIMRYVFTLILFLFVMSCCLGKEITCEATAYSVECGDYTATGHKVKWGIIAVDPSVIPLYSEVYIEGYGYFIALDTGEAIVGNRIDIWFPTIEDALNFGIKTVKVTILRRGK
jgi:3D (Asp-Asp-Asp) domain-containing protein